MPQIHEENANRSPDVLTASALQLASPVVVALMECDPDLREEAVNLFKQLRCNDLDEGDRVSTLTLLAELLFPNADDNGIPGLDLEEAEGLAKQISAEAKVALQEMDKEEQLFADRLRVLMEEKGVTQTRLAAKLEIHQSAIAMMLQRKCRPQKSTVVRMARALDVAPEELWPPFTNK